MEEMAKKEIRPKTAWINIISLCDNRCIWCYAKNTKTSPKIMPYPQIKDTLRRIKLIGCKKCVLIGGEPTLHPQISKILADGQQIGLAMRIISNGRCFAEKIFCQEIIKAGLKTGELILSMHASSENDSFLLTGIAEYFDEFKLGLENLTKLEMNPFINITISQPLINQVENMLYWVAFRKVKSVAFNLGAPAISQMGVNGKFTLSPDILANKAFRLFRIGKSLNVKIGFLFNIPFCLLSKKNLSEMLEAGAIISGCQVFSGSGILFNVDGDLVICNHLLDFPIIAREEIEKIIDNNQFFSFWTSKIMRDIRKAACVYRSEHCRGCDYWNICGGGCPMFWSYYNPQEHIRGWEENGQKGGDNNVCAGFLQTVA